MNGEGIQTVGGSPLLAHAPPAALQPDQPGQRVEVRVQRHGSAAVVTVAGRAGIGQTEPLYDELQKLAAEHVRLIVLDLHGLSFIGSEGLAPLLYAYGEICAGGGKIQVAAPQPAVRCLLERTRLTKLMPICESVEEALMQ